MKDYFENVDNDLLISKFGEVYVRKVKKLLNSYIQRWDINELDLIRSFSVNLVFKGCSKIYGPVVVKFGRDIVEFSSEVSVLQSLSNSAVPKVFDVDYEHMVYLMEALEPGEELSMVKNRAFRLDVFSTIHKMLHQDGKSVNAYRKHEYEYKTYEEWITRITMYMKDRREWDEVTFYMEQAQAMFYDLSKSNSKKQLLHGDLHYHNILKSRNGYKAIDPKGVIGDPIFDTSRYILNEFADEENEDRLEEVLLEVIDVISRNLKYKKVDLIKALYIEGTMAMCWDIESGADISEKDKILRTIQLLESYVTI